MTRLLVAAAVVAALAVGVLTVPLNTTNPIPYAVHRQAGDRQ
ncbi:hypothetical protein ACIOGZ_07995 [Kitasatospora sp. NPDC088160]